MPEQLTRHHDLVVIGTGSGTSVIGPELDHLDIGLVEKGAFGGTCLNVGCIPTKMFVLPSDRVVEAAESAMLGVHVDGVRSDCAAIRDRVFGRIDPIASGGEAYRKDAVNVTVYQGVAHFTGPMQLDTGTGVTITADRWVIAAGGRPRGLEIDGLRAADPGHGVHTSDTIMRVDDLPRRIVIVGGGFIAAEFAHVLDALGSAVTWVHRGKRVLTAEDGEISGGFTDLAQERFDLRLESTVVAAAHDGSGWQLTVDGPDGTSHVQTDAVLLAVGRIPNTDLLDATAGGLAMHDDGRLVVDAQQQTPVAGVWALGDISSDHQLKHVANHEMRVVKHNLSHPDAPIESDHRYVPHAVFSHPQIAAVGHTQEQLEAAGRPFRAATQKFGDVAFGWALEDTSGICKVLVDPHTLEILGAHLMGPMSSTLVQPLIQAMQFGQRADDIAKKQYWIHPALTEVLENALLGAIST